MSRRQKAGRSKGPTPRAKPTPPSTNASRDAPGTPAARRYRVRPSWHRYIGFGSIALGLALIVVNYIDYGDRTFLPGGHQEGYFFLGLAIGFSGSWWLGLFDRPQ